MEHVHIMLAVPGSIFTANYSAVTGITQQTGTAFAKWKSMTFKIELLNQIIGYSS